MSRSSIEELRKFLMRVDELAESDVSEGEFHTAVAHNTLKQTPAPLTVTTYASKWSHFEAYCRKRRVTALPASGKTIARYILACSTGSLNPLQRNGFPQVDAARTIEGRVAAIRYVHSREGVPYLQDSLTRTESIRSTLSAVKAVSRADESMGDPRLPWEVFRRAIGTLSMNSLRDRALLLVMYCGKLDPEQVAAINFEDFSFGRTSNPIQLIIHTPDGTESETIELPRISDLQMSPASAVRNWILERDRNDGPLFPADLHTMQRMEPSFVYGILAEALDRAGIEQSECPNYPLRRGGPVNREVFE
ncbi:hypothetical protein B2J88_01780 [Rhodococcus sp. SRB_17]|nr:hypothetical protein [Rhodococcus sp. SRB_17]